MKKTKFKLLSALLAVSLCGTVYADINYKATIKATDDTGVTGYGVTKSATVKPESDEWQTSEDFDCKGYDTHYAWAKDGAGNVSVYKSFSAVPKLNKLNILDEGIVLKSGESKLIEVEMDKEEGDTGVVDREILNWSSSNNSVAVVNNYGIVTGQDKGQTIVTVGDSSLSDTVPVYVYDTKDVNYPNSSTDGIDGIYTNKLNIALGEKVQSNLGLDANTTSKAFTFEVISETDSVTVDPVSGSIDGVAIGDAKVVTKDRFTGKVVNVLHVVVTDQDRIVVDKYNVTLEVGQELNFPISVQMKTEKSGELETKMIPDRYCSYENGKIIGKKVGSSNLIITQPRKDTTALVASVHIEVKQNSGKKPTILDKNPNDEWVKEKDIVITMPGLEGVQIVPSGQKPKEDGWSDNTNIIIKDNGNYDIYVKDEDGGIYITDYPVNNIDNTTPTVNVKQKQIGDKVILEVSANDIQSGLKDKPYAINGGESQSSNIFTVDKDGIYTISVTDKAGNTAVVTVVVKINKENNNSGGGGSSSSGSSLPKKEEEKPEIIEEPKKEIGDVIISNEEETKEIKFNTTDKVGNVEVTVEVDKKEVPGIGVKDTVTIKTKDSNNNSEDVKIGIKTDDRHTVVKVNPDNTIKQVTDAKYENGILEFNAKDGDVFTTVCLDDYIVIYTEIDNTSAYVNNNHHTLDATPEIRSERTLIPIRFIAENLKADVDWNRFTKTAVIKEKDKTMQLTIGENVPGFNVCPVLEQSRILVPMRYVSENLGATVNWDSESHSITVIKCIKDIE